MTPAGSFEAEIVKLSQRFDENPTSRLFAPLADLLRRAGRIEEAVDVSLRGLRRHPDYLSGLLVLARCHHDTGDLEEADRTFRRVLEADSGNAAARRAIGEIAHARGDLESALASYELALRAEPGNAELGERVRALRDESAGRVGKGAAPVTGPGGGWEDARGPEATGDEMATLTMADVYADQGHHARALAIYRRLLVEEPGSERLRERIERLEGAVVPEPARPAGERRGFEPNVLSATGDEVVTAGRLEDPTTSGSPTVWADRGRAEASTSPTAARVAREPWAFLLEDEVDHDPDQVFAGRAAGAEPRVTAATPAAARSDAGPSLDTPEPAAQASALPEDDLRKFQEWLKSLR